MHGELLSCAVSYMDVVGMFETRAAILSSSISAVCVPRSQRINRAVSDVGFGKMETTGQSVLVSYAARDR